LIPDPKDPKAVALFDQWASVELTDFEPFALELVTQKYFNKLVSSIVFPFPEFSAYVEAGGVASKPFQKLWLS
jgi:hypothetical protein